MPGRDGCVKREESRVTPPVIETQPLSLLLPAAWFARGMTQLMLPFFRKSLDRFGAVRVHLWNWCTRNLA